MWDLCQKSDILSLSSSTAHYKEVVGSHALGTMNKLLAELWGKYGLVIGGTLLRYLNIDEQAGFRTHRSNL